MTPSRKKPGVAFWATVVVFVLLASVAVYGGAYIWMLDDQYRHHYTFSGPGPFKLRPVYRPRYSELRGSDFLSDSDLENEEFWSAFFGPAHWLDAKLRPKKWMVGRGRKTKS